MLLGTSPWLNYHKEDERKLKKLGISSVKVIFFLGDKDQKKKYLVSKKKHSKRESSKDNKWEFPGGRIDKKEKVFSALKRELKEEDVSKILNKSAREVSKNRPEEIHYKITELKDKSLHVLFLLQLKENFWNNLEEFYTKNKTENHESYGFYLISEEELLKAEKNEELWTPKSLKIFKALRKSRTISL